MNPSSTKYTLTGLACAVALPMVSFAQAPTQPSDQAGPNPSTQSGQTQLFVDDLTIAKIDGLTRTVHPAQKLERPVLEAEMPWEVRERNGVQDKRLYIYGSVIQDEETGLFKMWYARGSQVLYATSQDGIHWDRPILKIAGENNLTNLKLHSPSVIYDAFDTDPQKRYKAVGSLSKGVDEERLEKLKSKFELVDWYRDTEHRLYYAAYSADGLRWTYYPEPILLGCDTITLAQDPKTGEYLAFHKRQGDPRVPRENGVRQVFLSTSQDMETWSEPVPVMVTDEEDHQSAKVLPGGTHSEFYNMSAFFHAGQWLGLVTHFRRFETPKEDGLNPNFKDDGLQSGHDGVIDVQLVHSRDGRTWSRSSDRSPVIPLGPEAYDAGSILGVSNSPVIVGDEMWMYYTAITTSHGGALPEKELSIARAAWRLDGMASLRADSAPGAVETVEFVPEAKHLFVNADVKNGKLMVEVLGADGRVLDGYHKEASLIEKQDSTKLAIKWGDAEELPSDQPIRLKFYLENGDLYSYAIL